MTVASHVPAIIDTTGEVVTLDLSLAISAEDAAARLPVVQKVMRELRRYSGWLETVLTDEITKVQGRTELRIGGAVFEIKPDYEWVITEPQALYDLLAAARDRGEVTQDEMDAAVRLEVSARANNSKLNALSKRLPEIDRYRTRTETPPKLRTRSEK